MGCLGGIAHSLLKLRERRGVDLTHNKVTADMPTEVMPVPTQIILPMQQHIGAQCQPCVKKKDHVNVGTLIGHAEARTTSDIFSSVSGTVTEIRNIYYADGRRDVAVIIEPDGKQTLDDSVWPPDVPTYEMLIHAVKYSGIVGLGGAGFPTELKLNVDIDNIDTWLVNGAECEPYLSSDYREMVEHPDTILKGISTCLDLSGIGRAVICIEDNKPKAIEILKKTCAADKRIEVLSMTTRYPQGAAHVLVRNATGREVPRGGHTTDVGCVLFNVTTMSCIGRFLEDGMPLVRRRITVAGDAVARPQNLDVAIGTPIREVLEYCGLKSNPYKVVTGGPMMGVSQVDLDYPIVRQNSGLLAFTQEGSQEMETTACIRCGTCVNSCPMSLSPVDIMKAYTRGDTAALDKYMADLCMECGTCSYVCPARQPLTQNVRLARSLVKERKRAQRRAQDGRG
ncbi:MAG: electron transport complex subunit RsxC [Atopobiaceae bacterium]